MSNKDEPKHDRKQSPISARKVKKLLVLSDYLSKQESKKIFKSVTKILKTHESERTEEDLTVLKNNKEVVKKIQKNKERKIKTEERTQEREDSKEELQRKCAVLAGYLRRAKRAVIYTGAGISTAASIPDYRGPQGVWTLLQKGESVQPLDLSDAEPTFTHMCIAQLQKQGHVKHVVSQNCDGLHLRSGLPRRVLSEVHGNMFIEVCYKCKPHREYIRLFDTTENTGVRRHQTGRSCKTCGNPLRDTIVHFGEKGGLKSPYRWKEAAKAAEKTDLILCLGSSLKILKRYGCLWLLDRTRDKRPNLVIVNLQWTPKDDAASLKINGRCDDVLERVMKQLKYAVNPYNREADPIFRLCTPLRDNELNSTSKKVLERPETLRGLRSTRSSTRTPTPTPSESGSSTTSSSTDSSDIVDVENDQDVVENNQESIENEKVCPKSEIILDIVKNETCDNDQGSELGQHKNTKVKEEKVKTENTADLLESAGNSMEEHKSLIADNLHDYAHTMTPKSEPVLHQQNSVHEKDSVDNNSLSVYRQLLHLHLLQKQLESLKSLQKTQPQVVSHDSNHLPSSLPQLSLGQPFGFPGTLGTSERPPILQGAIIAGPGPPQIPPSLKSPFTPEQIHFPSGLQFPMQNMQGQHGLANVRQVSPGMQHISPNGLKISPSGCHISPDRFHLSPPGQHVYQGQVPLLQSHGAPQSLSTPHPVSIYQNASFLSQSSQFAMNAVEQADFVRMQMQQMQSPSSVNLYPGMNFPVPNSMSKSHVPNVFESQISSKTSLDNTIQKCVQNIRDPKQLVLQHQNITLKQNQDQERQVLEIQKQLELEKKRLQERHVNEIHRQLKLEVEKFHEQEIMQGILKDLLYKSEKGVSDVDKNASIRIDSVNEQCKGQTSDILKSHGYSASSSAVVNPSHLQSKSNSNSIFKHPLPYHNPISKQTETKCVNSDTRSATETLSHSQESSAKVSLDHNDQCSNLEKKTYGNKSGIPDFNALVNSLTMCQSCQFLREYGVKKRSCSSCKDLKNTQNVLNTQWMPERQPDIAKSPTKNASPSKIKCSIGMRQSSNKVNKHSSPVKGSRQGGPLSTHTYSEKDLQASDMIVQNEALGNGIQHDLRVNYAHKSDDRDPSKSSGMKTSTPKPVFDLGSNEHSSMHNTTSTSSFQTSGSSNIHNGDTADKCSNSWMMKNAYRSEKSTHASFDKKSNSDPNLCKKLGKGINEDSDKDYQGRLDVVVNRGMKRSHSQSEVDDVKVRPDGDSDATENVSDNEPAAKKAKLMRCTSVPGWFGKGLNIKKRRKYY